jgi:hypothetical protein
MERTIAKANHSGELKEWGLKRFRDRLDRRRWSEANSLRCNRIGFEFKPMTTTAKPSLVS